MEQSFDKKGFSVLEILLVIVLISILIGIVIIAINPGKQMADTHNAKRTVDVNNILNAVYEYSLNNNNTFPEDITYTQKEICLTSGNCNGMVDLGALMASKKYLLSIPFDPTGSSVHGAGYQILLTKAGGITVIAPDAEQGATISVTR